MMRVVFGGLGRGGEVGRFEEMAFVSMVFVVGDREKGPAYCGLVDWEGVLAGVRSFSLWVPSFSVLHGCFGGVFGSAVWDKRIDRERRFTAMRCDAMRRDGLCAMATTCAV